MIDRYCSPSIDRIWGRAGEFERLRFASELSALVTGGESLESAVWTVFDETPRKDLLQEWQALEAKYDHDIAAWVAMVRHRLPEEHQRNWHRGRTSSDLVETALARGVEYSLSSISSDLARLVAATSKFAVQHAETQIRGRTHGQLAERTSIGRRFALLAEALDDAHGWLWNLMPYKMSGPVGVDRSGDGAVESRTGRSVTSTQVVPRWHLAEAMQGLVRYSLVLSAIATEVRLGCQTGVALYNEVSPSVEARGSSAMPDKRNPIRSERAVGLARLLRSNCNAVIEAGAELWNERDISHSSVERVAMVDAFHLASFLTTDLTGVIQRLRVDRSAAAYGTERLTSAESLEQLLELGMGYDEAYALVQNGGAVIHVSHSKRGRYSMGQEPELWAKVQRLADGA